MTDDRSSDDIGSRTVNAPESPSAPGDDGFEQWIELHYASVYRYAYRLSGEASSAEDLAQQVFLNAWRNQNQLRDAERCLSWLLTITRNQFLKGLRKSTPESFSQWELQATDIVDPGLAGDDGLKMDLQQLLDKLPVEYRVVVLMFFFEGLSYKEIAETLEIKIGTVMSRLARAKQRLRALWETESMSER